MSVTLPTALSGGSTALETRFVDRRADGSNTIAPGRERRQFANSHDELTHDAAELARAIDGYKLRHRRRFITYEEMLDVVKSLGYSR